MRLDLDKAERLNRAPGLHECVSPLTLSGHVVADNSLFQLALVEIGEGDVREAVSEDPLVSFKERLPYAFRTTTELAFVVLWARRSESDPLAAWKVIHLRA